MAEPAYETYIVRIYRRDRGDPARLSGVVEVVTGGQTRRFETLDALLAILRNRPLAGPGATPLDGSGGS